MKWVSKRDCVELTLQEFSDFNLLYEAVPVGIIGDDFNDMPAYGFLRPRPVIRLRRERRLQGTVDVEFDFPRIASLVERAWGQNRDSDWADNPCFRDWEDAGIVDVQRI